MDTVGVYVLQPNGLARCRHVAQSAYMVVPNKRGQGLGKELCRHSVQEARKNHYTGMQFDMVVANNIPAIKELCRHSVQEARKNHYTGMQFDMVVANNIPA